VNKIREKITSPTTGEFFERAKNFTNETTLVSNWTVSGNRGKDETAHNRFVEDVHPLEFA